MNYSIESVQQELDSINLLPFINHLVELPKNSCFYCCNSFAKGKRLKTRDHLIAKAKIKLFPHRFRQVLNQRLMVRACQNCNGLKGRMSLEEFIEFLKDSKLKERFIMIENIKKFLVLNSWHDSKSSHE